MRLILLLTILYCCKTSLAQDQPSLESDPKLRNLYLQKMVGMNKEFISLYEGKYKKEFKEYIEKRTEDTEYYVKEEVYFFEVNALQYLEKLKNKIAVANPFYNFKDISVILARFPWANAYSSGDGTIAIIPELINYFDNENQFLYILCHEFAHFFAGHSEKSINRIIEKIHSDEFVEEVKEIKRAKYGQNTKLIELLNDNLYSQRKHSRDDEKEADSLGLVLFRNTTKCLNDSYKALQVLDEVSNDYDESQPIVFENLKLRLTSANESQMIEVESEERNLKYELVKSHPDVPDRVNWLKSEIKGSYSNGCTKDEEVEFKQFKKLMEFESINVLIKYDIIDKALIRAERLRVKYPNSIFLKGVCGYCMYRLYYGRKHHLLFNCSRMPSSDIEDPDLYNLLNSIYYDRITKIRTSAYEYVKDYYTPNQRDWRYLIAYARLINDMKIEDKKTMKQLKSRYIQFYPNGEYAKHFPYLTK